MNDNIKDILEGQRIRERLRRVGVYPMVGPRSPKGDKGESGPICPQGKQGIAGPPGIVGKIGSTGHI